MCSSKVLVLVKVIKEQDYIINCHYQGTTGSMMVWMIM